MAASDVAQKRYTFNYSDQWQGLSLHKVVHNCLPALGSRGAMLAIKNGLVAAEADDDEALSDGTAALEAGTNIVVDLRHGIQGKGRPKHARLHERIKVHYNDDDVIVVSKNAGTVSQTLQTGQKSKRAKGPSATELIKTYLKVQGKPVVEPILVQRLDLDTSGLMVVAKNARAAAELQQQFRPGHRVLTREYLAFVTGWLRKESGTWRSILGEGSDKLKKTVSQDLSGRGPGSKRGRPAITHYTTEEKFAEHSLLRLRLETGRTHQIRIHCAEAGHPILGDELYPKLTERVLDALAKKKLRPRNSESPYIESHALITEGILKVEPPKNIISRMALHCTKLTFTHPITGKVMDYHEPLPRDLQGLLKRLRKH